MTLPQSRVASAPAPASHPWKAGFTGGYERNPWSECLNVGIDAVLPGQFTHGAPEVGERSLLAAVLIDAVASATLIPPSDQSLLDVAWLRAGGAHPFGSGWVCEHLGLNHAWLLAQIMGRVNIARLRHQTRRCGGGTDV